MKDTCLEKMSHQDQAAITDHRKDLNFESTMSIRCGTSTDDGRSVQKSNGSKKWLVWSFMIHDVRWALLVRSAICHHPP